MTNRDYHSTKYTYCRLRRANIPCGTLNDLDILFTTEMLECHRNNIFGFLISDYTLINSRCNTFYHGAALCPLHRYLLCEGYVPEYHCACYSCSSTTELILMGVRASLFIGNVPVLGYICSSCRSYYENRMRMANLKPILICEDASQSIWDCIDNAPPMVNATGAVFPEKPTSSTPNYSINGSDTMNTDQPITIMTQKKSDDCSSTYKSENETSGSTAQSAGLPNSLPVENNIKTNKMHLTLRMQQDGGSLGLNTHSNQQHHQSNVLMPQNNVHVIQETETNKGSQKRRFARQSSSSKSSRTELMEVQGSIYIKICASPSTAHECQRISMLDTNTFATLKAKIFETFTLNHCSNDFSLLYAPSYSDDIRWKKLKIEEENRTLAELSFADDYIVTYESSPKFPEKSVCTPPDLKQPDRLTDQCDVYPLPGLQNLGNTCFMNSALQCLNHVQPFFNYFRETTIKTLLDREKIDDEKTSTLTRLYSKLIESLCPPHDGAVVPVEFYMGFGRFAPRFSNYHQHDSLEFMNILLDILHEDLMRILQQNHTIISETFHGQIRTVVTCQTCKRDLETDDSFSFLPLPLPEENEGAKSSRTRSYKLDQCFQTFLQGEHIGNHGQWHCEHCNKLTNAKKTLRLCRLPPVLILQLKRFNYDLRSYTKIDALIEYDLDNLDLNEYVIPSQKNMSIRYNLIAVSNHWGSLIGGHYVTYAKLPGTEDWYKYNDDRVGKMDKNVHTNNYRAYILVYQQEEQDSIVDTVL